jgi:alpha-glucosidase (family GH31 glycosyl hydrolase)
MTGKEKDVFIKTKDGDILTGNVWPIQAAFPDFFKKETNQWWIDSL